MAIEFKLPELGEGADSATLVSILVAPGDHIDENQPVLDMETEKAVFPVPSTVSGTVKEILVKEGATLKPGDLIFRIDTEAGAAPAKEPAAKADTESKQAAPSANGRSEQQATAESKQPAKPAHSPNGAPPAAGAKPQTEPARREAVAAAPSIRRLARELGVDIHAVTGTGLGGRISEQDVKNYGRPTAAGGAASAATAIPLLDFSKFGQVERQPLSNVRRATAEHMARAWTVPHVTQFDKADVTALEELRKRLGKRAEQRGGKLTVTAIALKVAATALQKFPAFNCSIDLATNELVFKKYYNIGIAVETERGLLVPVIKNVDKKSVFDLAAELAQVSEKARGKKTTLEEMQGGTFTITNLGGIGGTGFTPIINVPEVAILGIARSQTEPRWIDNGWQPRLMLPLSLSYDHRVIDGADGARFLRWIAEVLEEPALMAFDS